MAKKDKAKDKDKSDKLSKKDYEAELDKLQLELTGMARWLQHSGKRVLVIVEGRDTAGKGGVINAITTELNPRQSRAFAVIANGTFLFCLPGSNSACRLGWEKLIGPQLDARTRPCNLAALRPRLRET